MARVSDIFTAADRDRVNEATREAESATSAEILPVVANCSGRYDRAEDIVGLWFAVLAMIALWIIVPLPNVEAGDWTGIAPVWQLVALIAGTVAGFVVGALVGERIGWLRRLFAPRSQMREEVERRARQVFFDQRVHHTAGGSGVLLYVSLFEKMAAVIADQSILDKLGQERIDEACREFTQRLQVGTPTDAISETAISLGRTLATMLPRAESDVNELADALVVIE